MATSVSWNGSTYSVPSTGERAWGTSLSAYLVAVASGALSKAGGSFTLTSADVDFGATYGLKAVKFASRNTPATTGIFRLGNAEYVAWRDAANSADLGLRVNSSNVLEFNGNPLLTLALGSGDAALVMNTGATAYSWAKLVNANIDAAAAIAYSKLALTGSILNADINASAAIAYSKLALSGSILNADINASAAIAYSKLALTGSILNADINASAAIAYSKLNLAGAILNADINASAAIARSKLASGTADHVVINSGAGAFSSEAQLAVTRGGTGQSTVGAAFKALAQYSAKGDLPGYNGSTTGVLPVGTDGQVLTADAASTYGVKWSDSGAGAGEINAVSNPSCASATTGYSAGTSHSVARDTSHSPLSPVISTSLAITCTSNASESSSSGGIYTISTHPTGLQNKKLKVEFYVTVPAGDTWALSVYAGGTTRVALSTDSSAVTTLPASTTGKFTAYFDADSSSSYKVNLTRTGGSGTTILYVTNLIVGPGVQPQGAVVGEWQSFTPTWSASAPSMSSNTGRWRRVGDSMQVVVDFTASGAGTGSAVLLTIPNSLNINTTLAPASNTSNLGNAGFYDNGTTVKGLWVGSSTSTQVAFIKTGETLDSIDGDEFANTDQFGATFTVPIAEWAGSGTVNIAQNDVEYVYNSSTTTSNDTTSFAYGPTGVAVASFAPAGMTAVVKRVQFITPVQPTDLVELQFQPSSNGTWMSVADAGVGYAENDAGTTAYGAYVQAGSTYCNVAFQSKAGPSTAWSSFTSWKWRVVKRSGGQAVGFGNVAQNSSGLVKSAGQLLGTNTNDSAATGYVGQYVESVVASGTSWPVATVTYGDLTSITLTAGDWDVSAVAVFTKNGATALYFEIGLGTASGTSTTGLVYGSNYITINPVSGDARDSSGAIPSFRVSISATTTYYLKGRSSYTVATPQYGCRLSARRVR